MDGPGHNRHVGEAGIVLPATVIFIFILMIATLGFSSMVTYETKGALYRQSSVEAFHLADGAIERARARMLNDEGWRGALLGVSEGNGTYDLAVRDTTIPVTGTVTKFVGTGHVGLSDRRIELLGAVEPTALRTALFVGGEAGVSGNVQLDGPALIVGDAYGASLAQPPGFIGAGVWRESFAAAPPIIYATADSFPGATYYSVRGSQTIPPQARIYNDAGVDVTPPGVDFADVLTCAGNTFSFRFDSAAKIASYFDPATGVFSVVAPDSCVVVNFGEAPTINPPGISGVTSLYFDGDGASTQIEATLINTRFVGTTEIQRLDPLSWLGSTVEYRECRVEPRNGFGLLGYQLDCPFGASVELGTVARPALIYVTDDVVRFASSLRLTGCLVALGDLYSTGGPRLDDHTGLSARLPDGVRRGNRSGVSGTVHVLRWRETAAPA